MSNLKLIYGHDPLCGWCYAIIPALRHFVEQRPDVPVEIVAGGLFAYDKMRPYAAMDDYIGKAFDRVEKRTGRRAKAPFFAMISDPKTGDIASAPPTHAIMQVAEHDTAKAVEFAHHVQDLHFEQGLSFNAGEVYQRAAQLARIENLDIGAALSANDDNALVQQSYERAACLNIHTFPKSLIMDADEISVLGVIDGEYDPSGFLAAFEAIEQDQLTPVT